MLRKLCLRLVLAFASAFLLSYTVQHWLSSSVSPATYLVFIGSVALVLVAVDAFTAVELSAISLAESKFSAKVVERFRREARMLRESMLIDGAFLAILAAAGYSFSTSAADVQTAIGERQLVALIAGVGCVLVDTLVRVVQRLGDVRRFADDVRAAMLKRENDALRAGALQAIKKGISSGDGPSSYAMAANNSRAD